jgi:signal peptidase
LGRLVIVAILIALVLAPVTLLMSGVLPYQAFVVQTGSMEPMVPPASLVVVENGVYDIGQVITFHKGTELVTHRLITVNADGTLTTKGDANSSADPSTINRSDVIGGVVSSPVGIGFWVMYFHNPLTLTALVLWALTIWFIWPREEADVDASAVLV